MKDILRLAEVTAAVGLKGEVRLRMYFDNPEIFKKIPFVLIDDQEHQIISQRMQKGRPVLGFSGINDRTAAESLIGKVLTIERKNAPKLEDNTYYIKDLIGLSVLDENGEVVGEISNVIIGPAQDCYEITDSNNKTFLVPAVEEFVIKIDLEAKQVVLKLIEGLRDL